MKLTTYCRLVRSSRLSGALSPLPIRLYELVVGRRFYLINHWNKFVLEVAAGRTYSSVWENHLKKQDRDGMIILKGILDKYD